VDVVEHTNNRHKLWVHHDPDAAFGSHVAASQGHRLRQCPRNGVTCRTRRQTAMGHYLLWWRHPNCVDSSSTPAMLQHVHAKSVAWQPNTLQPAV
jgi:hypothetical protein